MNNFEFDILELCEKDDLSSREKYWIQYYNSTDPNGYNLTLGGDGGNTFQYRTPEEMKETKRKIKKATSGENNGFYGKHHTKATKEYLRKINIGKRLSLEQRKKLSISLKGHFMPKSAKEKISMATKEQWKDCNFREHMRKVSTGNKYAKGNTWNKNRINIYNQEMIHKRVFEYELDEYIKNGYVIGIPPTSKLHTSKIKKTPNKNNTSGYPGVHFDKSSNSWVAYLTYNKKRYYGGIFKTKEEAIEARKLLELQTCNKKISSEDNI